MDVAKTVQDKEVNAIYAGILTNKAFLSLTTVKIMETANIPIERRIYTPVEKVLHKKVIIGKEVLRNE